VKGGGGRDYDDGDDMPIHSIKESSILSFIIFKIYCMTTADQDTKTH
jgi:hypothetical protein